MKKKLEERERERERTPARKARKGLNVMHLHDTWNCTFMTEFRVRLVCEEATASDDRSTPSRSTHKRQKSAAGQSKAVKEPRVISVGSDLSLLTEVPKRGGIVHKNQPLFVPESVAR